MVSRWFRHLFANRPTQPMRRSTPLTVETLENRLAPATLVNATTLTYQDVNGDNVSVVLSKPILTAGNIGSIFTFDSVNFLNNNTKQQLEKIDLQALNQAAGTNITVTATPSAANGGDGFANVGEIYALNEDLGSVSIDGDLGRIVCGDATTTTTGLVSLTAQSIGRFGTSTGALDLNTNVQGRLNKLKVLGDIQYAQITVSGGVNGDLGAMAVVGSLIGGPTANSGSIVVQGDAGTILINGDMVGSAFDSTGNISVGGTMTSLQVNGSIKGGDGKFSGELQVEGTLGSVLVYGSVVGAGGEQSGHVGSNTKITTVTIYGSLQGGAGKDTGEIFGKALGNVAVGGNVIGVGDDSGKLESDGAIGNVTINGSLLGGAGVGSGIIDAFNGLGMVNVKGDLIAGDVSNFSAEISGGNGSIAGVGIGGSILGGLNGGGRITSNKNIGNVYVGGSVVGKGASSGAIFNANDGTMGDVTIKGNLVGGADNGAGIVFSDGNMGTVVIGGSVLGGAGLRSGSIASNEGIANVVINGSLKGGDGEDTGRVEADGNIGIVRIGADVVGGAGLNSGSVLGNAAVKSISVGGNVQGGAGDSSGKLFSHLDVTGGITVKGGFIAGGGINSGLLITDAKLASLTVNGSLLGNGGGSGGRVSIGGNIGAVTIYGSIVGTSDFSGTFVAFGDVATFALGGNVQGGGDFAGRISISGNVTTMRINGSVIGGSASGTTSRTQSGYVGVGRVVTLTIGGSVVAGVDNTSGIFASNGAIRASNDLVNVTVKGSLVGNATNPVIISARGALVPTATMDRAINTLTVFGRAEYTQIIAGIDTTGVAKNADAQIGTITILGDWIASSVAAGTSPGAGGFYGDANDVKMSGAGVKDVGTVFSAIKSIIIGGQAMGTVGGVDQYGFVAEYVVALKVGGVTRTLTMGNGNDDLLVGVTGDLKVNEI